MSNAWNLTDPTQKHIFSEWFAAFFLKGSIFLHSPHLSLEIFSNRFSELHSRIRTEVVMRGYTLHGVEKSSVTTENGDG